MKTIRLFQISILLIAVLFTSGCANDTAQDDQQNGGKNSEGLTMFSNETTPNTRTIVADHTKGNSANVLWESTDYIWVKDDGGIFRKSSSTTLANPSNPTEATFGLSGSFTGNSHIVAYTGKNSTSATEVEIKATQTQAAANSFAH